MRKKSLFLCLMCFILTIFTTFNVNIFASADEGKIYLGGMPAGFSMSTNGAYVVGVCDVITNNGICSPSKDADIKIGDIILEIDGQKINGAVDVEKNITDKSFIVAKIKREGKTLIKDLKIAVDLSGNYKLGLFIRDDVCGIGTITFIKNNRFASLGHPVIGENNEILDINGGSVFDCNITGCVKGERGKAGELRGVFLKTNAIANIDKNLISGVYGNLSKNYDCSSLKEIKLGEAVPGDAKIYTTVCGSAPSEYSISIIKVDNFGSNKNFVIKITDKDLLENTGGIVQGMSGSPIIQNNKLVGAVTHVFINDPTRGFGIDIDKMINN